MFFIISQVFSWIILPINQIIIALGLSFFLKKSKWKKYSGYALLFLLFWYTSPITSSVALRLWEIPATPIDSVDQTHDIGIVLTGMTNMLALPSDRPHFLESVDRITDAITLYKKGKIKKLIISGGSGYLYYPELKESRQLKEFAVIMGVSEEDIIVEDNSQNTRQNAVHSMAIINTDWPNSSYLLITSATHMRRASACFRKAGGNPIIFSTDIKTTPFNWDFRILVPSADAIVHWTTIVREMVGCLAYWLAGYI